jgi:hypothetical protein
VVERLDQVWLRLERVRHRWGGKALPDPEVKDPALAALARPTPHHE